MSRKHSVETQLRKWKVRKSQITRQYDRAKSLTEKDYNTKYFHEIVNFRMRKKLITNLKLNGRVITGRDNLLRGIRSHFVEHYKQESLPQISLPWDPFRKVCPNKSLELEAIPDEEAILIAIKSCDPSKALGFMALISSSY